MIAAFIIGCEIGFWLFVLAGLFFRYRLGYRKTGAVLLACTPLVDLALIVATVLDLRGGAESTAMHGAAALYIGLSVAYGHRMIRWADERFRHRFAGGPAPEPPPKHGREHAKREVKLWFLHLAAWAIGCAILLGMIWLVGDAGRTAALSGWLRLWTIVLAVDFLWSFSYLIWPKKAKS
ncbi:hypothetical protein ACFQWB_09455 [Paenibacillus thermoaerophilus]|uniref:YmcC n=1 Tax=Paenibacillus thermoaerophilus TaxID=1215385 RepID=A0ABW2V4I5_9BACL|nr:hypothetical protein [Paenibacillus thermoaerophilus]TMV13924.1 hypothetical protein FE781_11045 [Paenibacillus thermoaerophilus]